MSGADRDVSLAEEVVELSRRVAALEDALHAIIATTYAARVYLGGRPADG